MLTFAFELALVCVVALLIYGFVVLTRGQVTRGAASRFVLLLGSGVTLVCAILWTGNAVEAITISSGTSKAIWAVLISGVLATSAAVFKQELTGAKEIFRVDRFVLLDERVVLSEDGTELRRLDRRNNTDYNRGSEKIIFCGVLRGFAINASGRMDVQIEVMVCDNNHLSASMLPTGEYSNPLHWKSKPYGKDEGQVTEITGGISGNETLFIGMVENIPSFINDGMVDVRVIATDRITGACAQDSKGIVLHQG